MTLTPEQIEQSKKAIIQELRDYEARTGKPAAKDKFDADPFTTFSSTAISKRFGTWNKAKKAAGLSTISAPVKKYSKEGFLKEIKAVADALGHSPTALEFNAHPLSSTPSSYSQKKFGSWNKAKRAAGIKVLAVGGPRVSDKRILSQLTSCAKRLGRSPTREDFRADKRVTISPELVTARFGSWNKAKALVGLSTVTEGWRKTNKEEVAKELRRVARKLSRTPTGLDFNQNSEVASRDTIAKLFGTWNDALRYAGLVPNIKRNKQEITQNVTDHIKKIGKVPPVNHYNAKYKAPSSPSPVYRTTGNWGDAVRNAGHIPLGKRTDAELIKLLQDHAARMGSNTIQYSDLAKDKLSPSATTYKNRFGSIEKACKKAGLTYSGGYTKVTRNTFRSVRKLKRQYPSMSYSALSRQFNIGSGLVKKILLAKSERDFGRWA